MLLSKADEDRLLLSKLTICVKFMHSMPGFDGDALQVLDNALKDELEPDQTHISERRFLKFAEPILKIANLGEHRLFEVIKEACLDKKLQTNSNFLNLEHWQLLIDLFKYIPTREVNSMFKKSTTTIESRSRRNETMVTSGRENKDLLKLLDYFDAKAEGKKEE